MKEMEKLLVYSGTFTSSRMECRMIHINSQYISGLLKPCTKMSTPLSAIIIKTDDSLYFSRHYFNSGHTAIGNKDFFLLSHKSLAQWVN